jgi:hypothetical protein
LTKVMFSDGQPWRSSPKMTLSESKAGILHVEERTLHVSRVP